MARTSKNIALGSARFRFADVVIWRRKVSHIRALRHKNVPRGLTAEDEPKEFAVEEKDDGGHGPGDDFRYARVHKSAHLRAVAGELNQRNHRKGQLKAKNHLAENDQRGDFTLAC